MFIFSTIRMHHKCLFKITEGVEGIDFYPHSGKFLRFYVDGNAFPGLFQGFYCDLTERTNVMLLNVFFHVIYLLHFFGLYLWWAGTFRNP